MKNTSVARGLHVPHIAKDDDTLTAAIKYAKAGWYVLPVKPDTKSPGSIVGARWQSKSSREVDVLTAWFAGTNYGIALHVGRSGATVFDVDKPKAMPELLRRALKAAPPPFQSSRPNVPRRGHYLYLTPKGRTLGNGGGKLGGAWGQVRGTNGVIIVAPTRHADGGKYAWHKTGQVPVMPDELAEALPEGNPAEDAASDATVKAFIAKHSASTRPELLTAWITVLHSHFENGSSRHDSTVSVMAGAMKEVRAGYLSARVVLDTLGPVFLAEVAKPPSSSQQDAPRTGNVARSEWRAIVAWAVGQALGADLDVVRQRVAQKMPPQVVIIEPDTGDPNESGLPTVLDVSPLENGFWECRESLHIIYTAALAQMLSPWAALLSCAAKALALVPPTVTLPPLVGGPGSLNFIGALSADSGGGKTALDVADDLIKHSVFVRNVGSGEGMIDAYRLPKAEQDDPEGPKFRESILFRADEVDQLIAMGTRSSSTTLPTIRSAFSGDTLGASTKTSGGFHLSKNSYRFVLIVGVQPAKAGPLLDDYHGGTPQRFLWVPAIDPRISVDAPPSSGVQLDVPTVHSSDVLHYGAALSVPDEAALAIRETRVKAAQGQVDARNSHSMFVREKFAYALALLDSRDRMNVRDWELSGVAMKVSDATRDWMTTRVDAVRDEEARDKGSKKGRELYAADQAKAAEKVRSIETVASWALRKITDAYPKAVVLQGKQGLYQKRDGDTRQMVPLALGHLAGQGLIELTETTARLSKA